VCARGIEGYTRIVRVGYGGGVSCEKKQNSLKGNKNKRNRKRGRDRRVGGGVVAEG